LLLFQVVREFLYHATILIDDILVVGSTMKEIVNPKAKLMEEFLMKDLGTVIKILEMRISREKRDC